MVWPSDVITSGAGAVRGTLAKRFIAEVPLMVTSTVTSLRQDGGAHRDVTDWLTVISRTSGNGIRSGNAA